MLLYIKTTIANNEWTTFVSCVNLYIGIYGCVCVVCTRAQPPAVVALTGKVNFEI